MLRDWGSWDVDFNTPHRAGSASVCCRSFTGAGHATSASPCRGSGTFSVEGGDRYAGCHVPDTCWSRKNGAYCQRIARICRVLGRKLTTIDYPEDTQVCRRGPSRLRALALRPVDHPRGAGALLKTSHRASSIRCVRPRRSSPVMARGLIVDAMSSFRRPLEIDARNNPVRCRRRRLRQVPRGATGSGLRHRAPRRRARAQRGATAIRWRWTCTTNGFLHAKKTTQMAFTHRPPMWSRRFDAAISPVPRRGAGSARAAAARYAHNCRTLIAGHGENWGFEEFSCPRPFRRRSS